MNPNKFRAVSEPVLCVAEFATISTVTLRDGAPLIMNDELTCKHCLGPKQGHHFVCHSCWKLLPRNFKVAFAKLKGQCFWWLREYAPNPTSTPQQPTNEGNQ
jgi:hypothetical protein